MTHCIRPWRGARWAALLVASALIVSPLSALAAEPLPSAAPQPSQPPPSVQSQRPGLLVLAREAAASMPAAGLRSPVAQGQTPTPADARGRDRWAFFKSPVGVAVLAGFAIGTSYAIYSAQHDRIKSPGRE